ncbi:MAG: twin-arginine translocase subunit TatC [Aigarchaeota archaeon]|nr:twin-arginine translocase subunit TatC [Aigarchaeota archaeon]MCS7117835.1 twin-arginine translocase subunit TatC [Candidatus Calditenuaceae archaeon]MDW8042429.1 twin-arginine translocase subunit TatC [Nitrososphaerota archaeon]
MKGQREMTFLEHLIELRNRVKVVIVSFLIALVFWLVFPRDLLTLQLNPESLFSGTYVPVINLVLERTLQLAEGRVRIIAGTITSPLEVYFIASALMAFITVSPVVAYELYMYVDPALYPHERRLIWGFMAAFVALFTVGSTFCYFVVMPLVIRFMYVFAEIVGAEFVVTAVDYYFMVFATVALMGFLFTAPAVFVLLVRLGIVSTSVVTRNRLYVYGLLYIAIALITPDGWLIANTVLFLPMVALTETAVLIAKRFERRREKAMEGPPVTNCRFCGSSMARGDVFCPACGRAQE